MLGFLSNSFFGLPLYLWIIIIVIVIYIMLIIWRYYKLHKYVMDKDVPLENVDEIGYSGGLLPWDIWNDIIVLNNAYASA